MKSTINRMVVLGAVILLIGSTSCRLAKTIPPIPTTASDPTQPTTISGPGGAVLTLEENALTDNAEIQLDVIESGGTPWEGTPFEAASQVFLVGFSPGDQVGGITLTVPLASIFAYGSSIALYQTVPISSYAYAAWVYPDTGFPSLVGALADNDQVTFPVVGPGKYQVLRIASSPDLMEMVDVKDPLSAPSYHQFTAGWCSTTAITDLAGYHEGAWPVGGLGSLWGESSNWFLAGKADQGHDDGYFFHWLLEAGGFGTPEDVKESFHSGEAEVYIWNFQSARILYELKFFYHDLFETYVANQVEYAQELFNFFHSYVEVNLWGLNGSRRPVAWGSALAGHSRLITGSDGTSLFYNDPAYGSWNQTISWDSYLLEVIDSISTAEPEIIDTTIFHAEPRPASERRAVLWFWENNAAQDGSIIFRRNAEGDPAAYWLWDGSAGHEYGFYYSDLMGNLPIDETLGVKFKAFSVDDVIEYGYSIRSISESSYDYLVNTELFNSEGGKIPVDLPDQGAMVDSGGRVDFLPAGSFPMVDLDPGLYYLKFTLSQGGVVQDVKYIHFSIAPNDVINIPWSEVLRPANCREGPGEEYQIRTMLEAGRLLRLVALDPGLTWGKFETALDGESFQCWVGLSMVDTKDFMDVPILEVPPPWSPLECHEYQDSDSCNANPYCAWRASPLGGPPSCQTK